jgi:hypothetical protein
MSTLSEQLLSMRKAIDADKRTANQIQGRLAGEKERLEKEHGVKTIKAAEAQLSKIDAELLKEEESLKQGLEKLSEEYDFS